MFHHCISLCAECEVGMQGWWSGVQSGGDFDDYDIESNKTELGTRC